MKINSLTILKVASEINSLPIKDLQLLSELLDSDKADAFATFISFTLQDRELCSEEQEVV